MATDCIDKARQFCFSKTFVNMSNLAYGFFSAESLLLSQHKVGALQHNIPHIYCCTCFSSVRHRHLVFRMSGRPSVFPFTIYVDPGFEVHLNDFFSETTAPMNLKFHMIRLQSFRPVKVSLVENPKWPQILKIAKPIKSTFSPEWLGIFG